MPKEGAYQINASFLYSDKKSTKHRKKRESLFKEAQNQIINADLTIEEIKQAASQRPAGNRELYNSEQRDIENEQRKKCKLLKYSEMLSAFSDDKSAYMQIEYGLANKQSMGIKAGYKINKFITVKDIDANSNYTNRYKKYTSQGVDLDLFYKYQLYQKKNFLITIMPKLHYTAETISKDWRYLELSMFAGNSFESKNKPKKFAYVGFGMRNYYNQNIKNNIAYVLYSQEGMEFKNGVRISNYTEYQMANFKNYVYRSTIYNEISIGKNINISKMNKMNFNIQVGYFWKTSVLNKNFVTSGPSLTLGCDF